MKFLVEMDFTDEHTILNAETGERVGGSMTMDDDQIRASISASTGIPEEKLYYQHDQMCYEVWEAIDAD